jgi:lipopolysaccharide export system protein LptA
MLAFGGTASSTADYKVSTAGSTGDLVITAVTANDCVTIGDGTIATDFKIDNITTADADIWFDQSADTAAGTLYIGKDGKGIDVKFFGEATSAYMQWDMSADQLVFAGGGQISLNDNVELLLGTGTANAGDFKIYSDGSNIFIKEISAAGKGIEIGQNDKGMDVKFFGEASGAYMEWTQASNELVLEGVDLWLKDDDQLEFGDASDITITWDKTNLIVDGVAADKKIRIGYTNNQDVEIYGDTTTDTVIFDTSAEKCDFNGFDLDINDADILSFGDGSDITITWDATDLHIDGASADTAIQVGYTNNQDIWIYGDTTTDNIEIDTSEEDVRLNGFDLTLLDDDIINFGDANDVTINWDKTDLHIDAAAANTQITVGATNDMDLYLTGAAGHVHFDASANTLGCLDNAKVGFGNTALAPDITVVWDASQLQIDGANADTKILIGYDKNQDIWIYGDTSTDNIEFDTSAEDVRFNGFDLTIQDDDILNFGDGDDISIAWDKTQLNIDGAAADKKIRIGYTNNQDIEIYGDTSTDNVIFDTSAEKCDFNGFDLDINDADILSFGDGADITITWDATDLIIDGAAADKVIKIGYTNNQDINIYGDSTADTVIFDTSGEMCTFNGFDLTMNDADIIRFGDAGGELTIASDATNTNITVVSGTLDIGDGGTTNYTSFDSTGDITQVGTAQLTAFRRRVVAKVGDYSVQATDSGTIFTNYGAGVAVNFTLPAKATGLYYTFFCAADNSLTVTADIADKIVAFNDAAADSVAYSTAGDKLGGAFTVFSDANLWYVMPHTYGDGVLTQTISIAT